MQDKRAESWCSSWFMWWKISVHAIIL